MYKVYDEFKEIINENVYTLNNLLIRSGKRYIVGEKKDLIAYFKCREEFHFHRYFADHPNEYMENDYGALIFQILERSREWYAWFITVIGHVLLILLKVMKTRINHSIVGRENFEKKNTMHTCTRYTYNII